MSKTNSKIKLNTVKSQPIFEEFFNIGKDIVEAFDGMSKSYQQSKEKVIVEKTNERKHLGIYYTHPEIAEKIVADTLSSLSDKELLTAKFYEPCVGFGIFVLKYIDYIFLTRKLNKNHLPALIENIYFSDIDKIAVETFIKILPAYIMQRYNTHVSISTKNYFIGNALFNTEDGISKNSPTEIFKVQNGFDVVITNPPYRLLKANANKYHTKDTTAELVNFVRKNNVYKFNQGSLNLYKMFVEEILENYTNEKGKVGLLIPNSILNDLQSEKLRKRILEFETSNFYIIPENSKYFPDITQGFCFFSINKSKASQGFIQLVSDITVGDGLESEPVAINIGLLESISENIPVIIEDEIGWGILKKIKSKPKLNSFYTVKNLRGELDLTLNKQHITDRKTQLRLLRGINIKENSYTEGDNYVEEDFLAAINGKQKYVQMERLAGQQISNMRSKKRLKFAKIDPNHVLGNSCNFIAIETNLFKNDIIDIDYLLAILNSFILDWRFKLTSSNNHVNNYELANLPIHKPSSVEVKMIKSLVTEDRIKLETYILKMYGLSTVESKYILNKYKNS